MIEILIGAALGFLAAVGLAHLCAKTGGKANQLRARIFADGGPGEEDPR